MRKITTKTLAALFAAVLAVSAFAGCAAGEGKEIRKEDSQASAEKTSTGEHSGEKKLDIYIDDNDTPYFYNSKGEKQMLFFGDFDDFGEDTSDPRSTFIYDHYEANGLSFDIPKGCFAEDMLGAPMVYKDAEDVNEIDYESNISIVPAKFMLGYDMDKDKKVDKKFIEKYFNRSVENGLYEEYTLKENGEGKIGTEDAVIYDITVTYKNDEDMPDLPTEKSRTICYVTKGKNCYIAAIRVPVDNEDIAKAYVDIFNSFTGSIKLPTEEQTKSFLSQYSQDPVDVVIEEDGDLSDGSFDPEIDLPDDGDEVVLSD